MLDMVKKLLENNTVTQEGAEALDLEIMGMVTPLRDDLKTLRDEKNILAESFKGAETALEAFKDKTIDIDKQIAEAKDAGRAEQVTALQSEREKNEGLVKELAGMSQTNGKLTMESGIHKAMSVYKDTRANDSLRLIGLDTSIVDGKLMYGTGDNLVSLEDGVKSFYAERQDQLEAVGDTGTGTQNNKGGGSNTPNLKDMTPSQKMESGRK